MIEAISEDPCRSPISIRRPTAVDGSSVWELIGKAGTLDRNSLYCNLLQCTDFADTCAIAERADEAVGWVSGYIPPARPETLFIWQVCVDPQARGEGLAGRLIADVLARPVCRAVNFLDTTITRDNTASWSLFRSLARRFGAPMDETAHFEHMRHFAGRSATEYLVRIGPFVAEAARRAA